MQHWSAIGCNSQTGLEEHGWPLALIPVLKHAWIDERKRRWYFQLGNKGFLTVLLPYGRKWDDRHFSSAWYPWRC